MVRGRSRLPPPCATCCQAPSSSASSTSVCGVNVPPRAATRGGQRGALGGPRRRFERLVGKGEEQLLTRAQVRELDVDAAVGQGPVGDLHVPGALELARGERTAARG